jgi:exodeoxyribonuclease V alpha subunit
MEKLEGTLKRIVYVNNESGYMVARLTPGSRKADPLTIVGNLAAVSPGEKLSLKGCWRIHPKYGRQFEVKEYESLTPVTADGIQKYLGSGLIKGIGPALSARIVDHFGKTTLQVIEKQPERLQEIEGIGPSRLERISQAWARQRDIREVMLFLKAHSVSTGYAIKIFKAYGQQAIRIVKQNPYLLPRDIFGIGFKIADRIAMKLGIAEDDPERIAAALKYTLNQAAAIGHVYLPRPALIDSCVEMLGVERGRVDGALNTLAQRGTVVIEQDEASGADDKEEAVFLSPFYHGEIGVTSRLNLIKETPSQVRPQQAENLLRQLKEKNPIDYAPEQEEAIKSSLLGKIMIITGGPGTGKTTTVRGIIQAMEWLNWRVVLAAPTGRAAKKLSEATGREAKTIHRLLGYSPKNGFRYDERNQLQTDAVIIDELSMVDLILMNNLVKAVPSNANLVLVGDVDQLPSVGAGAVLHALIASGQIHVVKLIKIFRQAQKSLIVVNAHRVNRGNFPYLKGKAKDDFFFIPQEEPEEVARIIARLVSQRLPKYYGLNPFSDIQVLTPMHRGAAGANNLNRLLQETLNPKDEIALPPASGRFRLGDKVMQIRNNYQKDIFNGDIGQITDVDPVNQQLIVKFPDQALIHYDAADLAELVLAYAITIHKSQGNEYRAVVMPMLTHHYVMLQRNLLYTGITRARELMIIVGSKKALRIACKNDKQRTRYSRLATRLAKKT